MGGGRVEVETAKVQAIRVRCPEGKGGPLVPGPYWVLPEVYTQLLISGKPTHRPDPKVYAKSGGVVSRVVRQH